MTDRANQYRRQVSFYNLLERYNEGIEPLSSWTTEDLLELVALADAELEQRGWEQEFKSPFDHVVETAKLWEDQRK